MAFPKEHIFTAEDYWNLPEGKRAELINGKFYDMALRQQRQSAALYRKNIFR